MPGRRSRPAGDTMRRCHIHNSHFTLYTFNGHARLGTRCGNATARPNPLGRKSQAERKARKWARRATDNKSAVAGEAKENSSKLTKRCGNLYENKGPPWKTWGRSW